MQKDNTTFKQKAALRRALLSAIDQPVIMETHGGIGALYRACYSHIKSGVVFEKSPDKTAVLAGQRPTWAVYEADCEKAIAAGAGAHLMVTFLDIDPYGSPWETMQAFFSSARPRASRLAIAVNDGLRNRIKIGQAWHTDALLPVVATFGNNLYPLYLDVCRFLVAHHAKAAGYQLRRFVGYYCGHNGDLTHYAVILEQG